jgi:DNA-binding transcriptional LysR family regulator
MPGGMEIFVLPKLIPLLSEKAPGIRLSTSRVFRRDIVTELSRNNIDLVIDTVVASSSDIHCSSLGADRLIVAARKDHELASQGLSKDAYLNAKHIAVSGRDKDMCIEDLELSRLDLKRDTVFHCAVLTAALKTVAASDYLVTLSAKQLSVIQPLDDIVTFDFPFSQPRLEAVMMWHDISDSDPVNSWMRGTIESLFSDEFSSETHP